VETAAPTEPVAPPPPTAANGTEAAVTPQQMAADDAPENDGVPAPAVLPPPLEQTV